MTAAQILFVIVLFAVIWAGIAAIERCAPRRDDDSSGFDAHGDIDDGDRQ